MKTKFRYLIIMLCCVFAFTACSGGETESETSTDVSTVETDENGNEIVPKPPTKVGFVYNGMVDEGGTVELFEAARSQIEKALGLETCYIEGVLVNDFAEAVDVLVEDGCNVIVTGSSKFANITSKSAQSHSDVKYVSFGGTSAGGNVSCFQGELFQTANVCGLIAAYNSESNILGILCDPNAYAPYTVIDAYILGAKEITGALTKVKLNWAYSDQQEYIEKAIDDLAEQGCDIIMCYTESEYAVKYCEEKGIKVIGNLCNMPDVAPKMYLTGFFYNLNTYIIDMVRSVANDTFNATTHIGGIAEGTARLIEPNPALCFSGTKDVSDTLYEFVKQGQSVIFMGEVKDNSNTVRIEKGRALTHTQSMAIDWVDQTVSVILDFTEPVVEPVSSDFIIKGKNPDLVAATTAAVEGEAPVDAVTSAEG